MKSLTMMMQTSTLAAVSTLYAVAYLALLVPGS
jgi:hypothetical protein